MDGTDSGRSRAAGELRTLIVGASGGIGAELALAGARLGAPLVLHGRNPARLASLAGRCGLPGGVPPRILVEDLSSGLPGDALMAEVLTCDALAVAFGPFLYKPLAETRQDEWRAMALQNLALPSMLAAAAAAAMAGRGFGRILLFGGTRTDAIRGFKLNAAYAAAKTGLGVVAKSIAAEFSGRGVSCAVICPGFVDTEYQNEEDRRNFAARSPRGKLIPAASVADAAWWLLSGGMDLCNGAVINADEGLYAL